ncbi:uncharacterized protein LOC143625741 [Bidens hawaiensis]|uniref:uncharacterized protein LOC143625741 n=1 Tax=Bidens hawaiensis TaxID=980011 RepID=UPI0040496D50
MGACISTHHKASAMKAQVPFDSAIKPDHTSVIHPSPSSGAGQLLSVMDEEHVAVKPQLPASFSEYGSREETFFDSQAWLESDYEDEFMSVNGEFTPSSSRGSTPGHHDLTQGTARVIVGATFMDQIEPVGSTSQPSPTLTEKRRRLLDLFKESQRDNNNNLDSSFELDELSDKDGHMGSDKDGLKPKSVSHVGSMQGCFKNLMLYARSGKQKSPTRT